MRVTGRNRLIGAVHAATKAAGLDDDTYRGMLEKITGKRSARDLTDGELRQVLDHMNAGADRRRFAPPKTSSPTTKKARALWISIHALGGVSDPSETALRSWVKRQFHVDDIAFVKPSQSFAVIEGLKQWCVRLGVNWAANPDPRRCVLLRQIDMMDGEMTFLPGFDRAIALMNAGELDEAIAMFGRIIRGEHA